MERKYRALRIIGAVYKILGGLAGILTALLVLTICASSLLGGAALSGLERELGGGGGTGFVGGTLGGLVAVLVTILYGGGLAVTQIGRAHV